eukprot:SAG31_NODE_305_length_18002_cov_7.242808_1_plen_73_part_00
MKTNFPMGSWDADSPLFFGTKWEAFTNSFEAVLASWDDDVFAITAPVGAMPLMGLIKCNIWSRSRGEAKQAE